MRAGAALSTEFIARKSWLSNVMVRALADTLGGAEEIETALLLSAGDVSGPKGRRDPHRYGLHDVGQPTRCSR